MDPLELVRVVVERRQVESVPAFWTDGHENRSSIILSNETKAHVPLLTASLVSPAPASTSRRLISAWPVLWVSSTGVRSLLLRAQRRSENAFAERRFLAASSTAAAASRSPPWTARCKRLSP